MTQSLRAIYRNGAFVPQTAFELPEGTEVELWVQSSQIAFCYGKSHLSI